MTRMASIFLDEKLRTHDTEKPGDVMVHAHEAIICRRSAPRALALARLATGASDKKLRTAKMAQDR